LLVQFARVSVVAQIPHAQFSAFADTSIVSQKLVKDSTVTRNIFAKNFMLIL
jgi:hypothetical protein